MAEAEGDMAVQELKGKGEMWKTENTNERRGRYAIG